MRRKIIVVGIYVRKSVLLKKGDTLEMQEEICKKRAKADLERANTELVFLVYSDQQSGVDMDRDGLQRFLKEIKEKKIQYLYVYKLDRIGRNTLEILQFVTELENKNVVLRCTEDPIDTSASTAKIFIQVLAMMAEMERDNIIARVTASYDKLSRQGFWLGGNAPFGFKSEYIENQGQIVAAAKKIAVLKQVPDEVLVVKYIFSEYTKGNIITYNELSKRLKEKGFMTSKGKAEFDTKTLGDILKNPVYVKATEKIYDFYIKEGVLPENISDKNKFDGKHGILNKNKTTKSKSKMKAILRNGPEQIESELYRDLSLEEMPDTVRLSKSEWIVAVAPHEGFIDDDVWLEAQRRIKERKSKKTKICGRRRNNVLFSTDKMICAKCGSVISSFNRPSKSDGNIMYPTYRCEGKHKQRNCDVKNINAEELDRKMVDEMFRLKAKYIKNIEYLQELIPKQIKNKQDDEETRIRKQKKSLEKKSDNLRKNMQQSIFVPSVLDKLNSDLADLEMQIKKCEEQLVTIEKDRMTEKKDLTIELLPKLLLDMNREQFDQLPMESKKYIVNQVFSYIEWDGKNVTVHFKAKEKLEQVV